MAAARTSCQWRAGRSLRSSTWSRSCRRRTTPWRRRRPGASLLSVCFDALETAAAARATNLLRWRQSCLPCWKVAGCGRAVAAAGGVHRHPLPCLVIFSHSPIFILLFASKGGWMRTSRGSCWRRASTSRRRCGLTTPRPTCRRCRCTRTAPATGCSTMRRWGATPGAATPSTSRPPTGRRCDSIRV